MTRRAIWAITDGKAGMVNQALGLAEAVASMAGPDWEVIEKTVVPAVPWSLVPAGFWPSAVAGAGTGSSRVEPPWPDIVVSCGRHAVGPALHVKRQSRGRSFIVHAQHPRTGTRAYDLVIAQSHDRLHGANVFRVLGSMNRVTRLRLDEGAAQLEAAVAHLPRPLVAVMIGGSNGSYRLTATVMERLAADLRRLAQESHAGLLVTASRRTGSENEAVLRKALSGIDAYFWDGTGANPYFGFLALADAFVVTCDSVNMVSEACGTGKAIFVAALEGHGGKFARFHDEMRSAGYTRPFSGVLTDWTYVPLEETRRAAEEVLRRYRARPGGDRSTHRA